MVVMCASVMVVGVSYGVAAHSAGLQWWQIIGIAALVLAGTSEFVFVGVIAAGGLPILAALAGVLVNLRNVGYGLSIGKHLGRGAPMLLGAHLINDESAALAAAESDPRRARAAFYLCGIGIAICWPAGAAIGAGIGELVASPEQLGLDAAFPALLAALAVPALRDRRVWAAAALGGTIALSVTPFLAAGLPVIAAMVGFAGVELVRRGRGHGQSIDAGCPVSEAERITAQNAATTRHTDSEAVVR
ncbi:AzlC family ABC transporter permease [Gordonia sinesedis]